MPFDLKKLLTGEESPDFIAVAGDWHGNQNWAVHALTHVHKKDISVVVHVGDFGFWRAGDHKSERYLDRVNETCEKLDMIVLWVDGNHEDHDRLNAIPVDTETGVRPIRSRIFHLPRGFRWTWHGKKWLALGGAASVDKDARIEGMSWWRDEVISYAEASRAIEGGNVDVMVTHDAPDRTHIPGISDRERSPFPSHIQYYADGNRRTLGEVVDAIKPSLLFHGHMHVRYETLRTTEHARTLVIGLDCDSTSIDDNICEVSLKR